MRILLPVVAALGFAAGCYTQGDVGVSYSYGYAAPAPSLYYVSPGVQVVAYSDYPVFYSDNYYWRYDGGIWYRSSYYGGGWVVYNDVPYSVRSIDRPYRYARYQPGQGSSSAEGYRGGVNVRDHHTYSPPPGRAYNAPPARSYNPPPGRSYNPPPTSQPAPDRDHRTYQPPPATSARPAPSPPP